MVKKQKLGVCAASTRIMETTKIKCTVCCKSIIILCTNFTDLVAIQSCFSQLGPRCAVRCHGIHAVPETIIQPRHGRVSDEQVGNVLQSVEAQFLRSKLCIGRNIKRLLETVNLWKPIKHGSTVAPQRQTCEGRGSISLKPLPSSTSSSLKPSGNSTMGLQKNTQCELGQERQLDAECLTVGCMVRVKVAKVHPAPHLVCKPLTVPWGNWHRWECVNLSIAREGFSCKGRGRHATHCLVAGVRCRASNGAAVNEWHVQLAGVRQAPKERPRVLLDDWTACMVPCTPSAEDGRTSVRVQQLHEGICKLLQTLLRCLVGLVHDHLPIVAGAGIPCGQATIRSLAVRALLCLLLSPLTLLAPCGNGYM
jgi:hypothetical protein